MKRTSIFSIFTAFLLASTIALTGCNADSLTGPESDTPDAVQVMNDDTDGRMGDETTTDDPVDHNTGG